jgi:hypothetical protein
MNFKNWMLNEGSSDLLYQQYQDGDVDFDDIISTIKHAAKKWYVNHEYDFDWNAFKNNVLNKVKFTDGNTLKEILHNSSNEMLKMDYQQRVQKGYHIVDEPYEPTPTVVQPDINPYVPVPEVPQEPVSFKPTPVFVPEVPQEPTLVPEIPKEPISFTRKPKSIKTWQPQFNVMEPDYDPGQRLFNWMKTRKH